MVKPSSGIKRGLVHVEVSGTASLTDDTMEALAATCATLLEELDVSFCPRLTDRGLGWLVDTDTCVGRRPAHGRILGRPRPGRRRSGVSVGMDEER